MRNALCAGLAVALAAVVPAVPAQALPAYQNYVALGDSFTAGPLIPEQRADPAGCRRSSANYSSLLAGLLVTRSAVDASCSGADTTHLTQPQELADGSNRPQLDALRPETDLVTVGLGVNDYNLFQRIVDTCPALRPQHPTGAPCRAYFTVNGTDTLRGIITQTEQNLTDGLRQVRERAPRAKVLAVGYPRVVPSSGFCGSILPFADGDYAWVAELEQALNDAIADAAADSGSSYVDVHGPSLGHDACAQPGSAWVNGDLSRDDAARYHPVPAGMQGVSGVIFDHLRRG
ncbi:SGNH/GDSL hydrolase family protein [Amycolatopsis sp. YIM 10]|uniref:SGNH/GDSL hydrolase family protein n=1 Tax=Amycolatopsis sp. YIM 10 TaxID=2653857 RepID=UPI00128FCF47|nr:SGNH/GDSL hydrolase family protein [Amycolatopsis sp. YIM 10]QFU92902.1 Lipase 2 precursor [Amycolatopsis sp. YIM 10]